MTDYAQISDDEQRALTIVVDSKHATINALNEARAARKARGEDTTGIEESIDYEQLVLAGYVRALDNRKKAVAPRVRRVTGGRR